MPVLRLESSVESLRAYCVSMAKLRAVQCQHRMGHEWLGLGHRHCHLPSYLNSDVIYRLQFHAYL